jgi:aminomethyltransferase
MTESTDSPPTSDAPPARYSPLHAVHVAAGASFTDFAGWQMPVRYSSDLAEHHAVRAAAGLFDLSHMAEFAVAGPQAAEFLDFALAGKLSAIELGQAKYSLLLAPEGGIIDDVVVYRTGDTEFLIVANASNRDPVAVALQQRLDGFDTELTDASDDTALIAVQGPASLAILESTDGVDASGLAELRYYRAVETTFRGERMLVARTGYTGEDGFEIGVAAEQAEQLWNALVAAGVKPAGLGARDTLRLEAGMNLYGQDMDDTVNPLDAGLAWTIDLVAERDFIGKAALQAMGQNAQFVGLILREKGGVLRAHQKVIVAGTDAVGEITSGTFSPSMQQAIALARVPNGVNVGDTVHVEIRDKKLAASVVKLPFVRNGKILAV